LKKDNFDFELNLTLDKSHLQYAGQ